MWSIKQILIIFIIPTYVHQTSAFPDHSSDGIYGIDWMYFPGGDGVSRKIDLTPPQDGNDVSIAPRMKQTVELRLYTKDNTGNYIDLNREFSEEELKPLSEILSGPSIIKVITHGWISSVDGVSDIVNAYLQNQTGINVIAVDWSSYAKNYVYFTVADETKIVGKLVAILLDALHDTFNISGDNIHLIGHSLGSHVMAVASHESKIKIGRITGLDPALPMFNNADNKIRLDHGDAKFVDVIHTSGGLVAFSDPIGHADFYPNSGIWPQPGCEEMNVFQSQTCSHGRAIEYFAESILNPEAFPCYKCGENEVFEEDCTLVGFMGEHASSNMSGSFYLRTHSKKPYGRRY